MFIDYGYGVDLYIAEFVDGFTHILFGDQERDGLIPGDMKGDYLYFCESLGYEPYTTEANEAYMEGDHFRGCKTIFLAAILNKAHFHGMEMFIGEDDYLYVPARLPESEYDKPSMLTQEEVRGMLSELLNPLLKHPVEIRHLEVAQY